jgi:tryptophan synthase alpha chain
LDATLRVAREIRAAAPAAGIVLFGYYNPLFIRGEVRVARESAEAGIDALLAVDLPSEESVPLREAAGSVGVGVVPLLAPTSRAERVTSVGRAAKVGLTPFVYYVSVTGVTGSRQLDAGEAGARAGRLSRELGLPVVVGFGVDSYEKARAAATDSAGVVVGTAIVRVIEAAATPLARREGVERLVRELRAGVDAAVG